MKYKVFLGHVKDSFQIIGRGTVITFEATWPSTVNVGNVLLLILPDMSQISLAVMGIEHINAKPPLTNPYGLHLGNLPSCVASIPPGTQVYLVMNTDDRYLQATAAAYDQIAPAFRSVATPCSVPDSLSAYGHRLIAQVGASGKLIDIGCGVGNNMSWFAERGAQVVGIDLSMGMLQLAQHETDQPFSRMSMLSLGFADHTFAAAWCCASLLHLPKDIAPIALSEIARVLTPSGSLMLSVQVRDGETWNGGYVEGVQRFFARYRLPEMTALLQRTGFEVIDHREDINGDRTWLAMLCQVQK